MISRRPGLRPVVLKIGTLDNPLVYGGAQKGDLHGRKSLRTACPPFGVSRYDPNPLAALEGVQ
jgi:hypothetical protein